MFSTKSLTPEQIESIRLWVADGATMSDLQRRMKDEFALSLTYMETRFLSLDLGLEFRAPEKPAEKKPDETPADETPAAAAPGAVHVTMDTIAMPGAIVSGHVTFSDGETGMWMIDQQGRPGLDPDTPGYRPTAEDIADFQVQLRGLISRARGAL